MKKKRRRAMGGTEGLDWGHQEEVFCVEEGPREHSLSCRLFVGNLPFNVSKEDLARLFRRAGLVEVADVGC